MIVKRFGCMVIHNKALYKCIIHSYIYTDAPDINMLTNVIFFGCLYFIESDTCTTDNES